MVQLCAALRSLTEDSPYSGDNGEPLKTFQHSRNMIQLSP